MGSDKHDRLKEIADYLLPEDNQLLEDLESQGWDTLDGAPWANSHNRLELRAVKLIEELVEMLIEKEREIVELNVLLYPYRGEE